MTALDRMANMTDLKRKWPLTIYTGALECQLQLGTTARTGESDTYRIYR